MTTTKFSFHGTDADNETSLLEYGLLVSNELHEDGSGTQFCVYRIDENHFGTGHYKESEFDAIIKGEEWANEEDINGFLSFVGTDKNEWLNLSFVNKMSDLINYWGIENICGTDYCPLTENEAKEKYL
jgi:hypothetical protein